MSVCHASLRRAGLRPSSPWLQPRLVRFRHKTRSLPNLPSKDGLQDGPKDGSKDGPKFSVSYLTIGLVVFLGFGAATVAVQYSSYLLPKLGLGQDSPPAESSAPQTAKALIIAPSSTAPSASARKKRKSDGQQPDGQQPADVPGVHVWGCNSGKVADPLSDESVVKTPRRIRYFDSRLLRDLKLSGRFAVAVTETGDLVQWGTEYSPDDPRPAKTLTGKDIVRVEVSADRVVALSADGTVYSLPASRADQLGGTKQSSPSNWLSWLLTAGSSARPEPLNFRRLTPTGLAWNERVTDISSGLYHCLMLTSRGRVFSAASSTIGFPSRGELGVPGLAWSTRPPDRPYDEAHEVRGLSDRRIVEIATGSHHSVVLDDNGNVLSFGDNTFGQLGIDGGNVQQPTETQIPDLDLAAYQGSAAGHTFYGRHQNTPTAVPIPQLYSTKTDGTPRVRGIAAGGFNTFYIVDVARNIDGTRPRNGPLAPATILTDVWTAGHSIFGSRGDGRWTHATERPVRLGALSALTEFDEKRQRMTALPPASLSVGATHAAVVLAGGDAMLWGGNTRSQLGTGRRTNLNVPTFVPPLSARGSGGAAGATTERLQLTTSAIRRIPDGRVVQAEQRIECGDNVTAVYLAGRTFY